MHMVLLLYLKYFKLPWFIYRAITQYHSKICNTQTRDVILAQMSLHYTFTPQQIFKLILAYLRREVAHGHTPEPIHIPGEQRAAEPLLTTGAEPYRTDRNKVIKSPTEHLRHYPTLQTTTRTIITALYAQYKQCNNVSRCQAAAYGFISLSRYFDVVLHPIGLHEVEHFESCLLQ